MVDKILVREYLSSLKEDAELDNIFVLLLESMGFEIIMTPKESKGQSQYGKDIVAVGKDENEKKYRWYFELKGFDQKDININTIAGSDRVFQSLIEAKFTKFDRVGNKKFDKLPIKVVIVHNGITDPKFQPTFKGIVSQYFKEDEFEDWDIYRLADYFSEHLFNAYIFTNEVNANLFKRLLIFLSVADYDFLDLETLLQNFYLEYTDKQNERQFRKLFSSINMVMMMIWHYSNQADNLTPAKYAINLSILKTWAFILKLEKEGSKKFQNSFSKLIFTQLQFNDKYFEKTFEVANSQNGLFMKAGFSFESMAFPMRAFEYLDGLIYHFKANNAYCHDSEDLINRQKSQKGLLIQYVINNKNGCQKPILDVHLIPIHHLVKFFLDCSEITQDEVSFLINLILNLIEQIMVRKRTKGVFPFASSNLEMLIRLEATGTKHIDYPDSSSLLIAMLFEYMAIFNLKMLFEGTSDNFTKELDLQIAQPDFETYPDFEERLFSNHLNNEYFVDIMSVNSTDFDLFRENRKNIRKENYPFRTAKVGFGFLITLTQSFYKNEPFPEEWREWFDRVNIAFS